MSSYQGPARSWYFSHCDQSEKAAICKRVGVAHLVATLNELDCHKLASRFISHQFCNSEIAAADVFQLHAEHQRSGDRSDTL